MTPGVETRSPLIIVGIAGSGTTPFARLAEAAGRNLGGLQNKSKDALALYRFADKWCEPVYRAWRRGVAPPDRGQFEAELAVCIEHHLQGTDRGAPWGWKQPRSSHLLPALALAYPDLLLLHVLRDGRDVAFGKQVHLDLTGAYSIPRGIRDEPAPIQMAHLWATANTLVADFGESKLRERYLQLRLEDLCEDPDTVSKRLVEFVGGELEPGLVEQIVERPASIGRWRDADPDTLDEVTIKGSEALHRFNYMW